MQKKIILLDGNSLINRAFYGIPMLTAPSGEPTNAVYGFLGMLLKLLDEEKPDYLAVAFDVKEKTFRHDIYSDYKGTRSPSPPELHPQIALCKSLLQKMRIKTYEKPGFEADDIIGTLASKASAHGFITIIVSGDKDMLQLADETTLIRIPKTKSGKTVTENYTKDTIVNQFGIPPQKLIEVKALMGDTSDNIPGVDGIGEVTALRIIRQYGCVEEAIKNSNAIKPKKAAANLVAQADTARLSRVLAEIRKDVPIEFSPENMTLSVINNDEARAEILRLGLKSIADFLRNTFPVNTTHKQQDYGERFPTLSQNSNLPIITGESSFYTYITAKEHPVLAVCTGSEFFCFPIDTPNNLSLIKKYMESDLPKITLNSKEEIKYYSKHGIDVKNIVFDASIAMCMLNPLKSTYEYEDIAFSILNEDHPAVTELSKQAISEQNHLDPISYDLIGAIVSVLFRAYPHMKKQLSDNSQENLYYNTEMPLTVLLSEMELAGICVNADYLRDYGNSLSSGIDELTAQIYELTNEEFNINSPSQLGEILFNKIGLRGGKKTKTGWSTSADVLEKLVYAHPVVKKVLEYRTLTKLNSTYVNGLIPLINSKTGRIHTEFRQMGTATGRLSSHNPNLQNIPIRLPLGRELRKAFIPQNGFIFMDADYNQIELRVLAHMSRDARLIDAYNNGADIHAKTASEVFSIPPELVRESDRNAAKAVNFGIIYGISGFGLARDTGLSNIDAKKHIDAYYKTYPGVKAFLDKCVISAREKGYSETMFGRRRPIPEINTANHNERGFAERVAKNTPIQGTAADIIKIAMVRVASRLKKERLISRIVLQIHDELLLEVKNEEQDIVRIILKQEMENAVSLSVPLVADVKTGNNWYEAK